MLFGARNTQTPAPRRGTIAQPESCVSSGRVLGPHQSAPCRCWPARTAWKPRRRRFSRAPIHRVCAARIDVPLDRSDPARRHDRDTVSAPLIPHGSATLAWPGAPILAITAALASRQQQVERLPRRARPTARSAPSACSWTRAARKGNRTRWTVEHFGSGLGTGAGCVAACGAQLGRDGLRLRHASGANSSRGALGISSGPTSTCWAPRTARLVTKVYAIAAVPRLHTLALDAPGNRRARVGALHQMLRHQSRFRALAELQTGRARTR